MSNKRPPGHSATFLLERRGEDTTPHFLKYLFSFCAKCHVSSANSREISLQKASEVFWISLSIAFAVWPYLLHFQTELENFVTKQSVSGCAVTSRTIPLPHSVSQSLAADNDGINEEEVSLPLAPLGSGDRSSQVHAVRLLLCILGQVS